MDERSEEQLEQHSAEAAPGNGAAAPEAASNGEHAPPAEATQQPESTDEFAAENPADANPSAGAPVEPVAAETIDSDSPTSDPAPEMPAEEYAASVEDDSLAADSAETAETEEPTAAEESSEPAVAETSEAAPPPPAPKKNPSKVKPLEEVPAEELVEEEDLERDWYILKVQSNREKSIRDALERRVKVAGLERFFGEIIVPTEDIVEYKNGKRRITKRKLWPGYIVVNMAINDDTWFLVRETPGIGDFTGSIGKPTPMLPQEVERIIPKPPSEDEEDEARLKTDIPFKQGDRVRVKDGYFQNFEGDVDSVDEANGRVTVMISVFGRSTPVELEHWHIENV